MGEMKDQERIMLAGGYVTARKAAELAGIEHVGTIHRWARDGKVRYQRGGEGKNSPWYIELASLLARFQNADNPPTTIVDRISSFMATSTTNGQS